MAKAERELEPLLLTVLQVASELQIGRNTAYELIAQGQIPAVKIRRQLRVPRQALDNWIQANTKQAPAVG